MDKMFSTPRIRKCNQLFIPKSFPYFAFGMCLVFLGIASCGSCTRMNEFFHLQDDNIIEEVVEGQMTKILGVELDLTPSSIET